MGGTLSYRQKVYKIDNINCEFSIFHNNKYHEKGNGEFFIFYLNKQLKVEAIIWDTNSNDDIAFHHVSFEIFNNEIKIKDDRKKIRGVDYEVIITIHKRNGLIESPSSKQDNETHINLLKDLIAKRSLYENTQKSLNTINSITGDNYILKELSDEQYDNIQTYLNIVNIITNDEYI